MLDARADGGDGPDCFVARNERQPRRDWPVTLGCVQIGMAVAACHDLDQALSRRHTRDVDLLDRERPAELAH
jgi:hypothetical protein